MDTETRDPLRADRLKPVEFLGLSGAMAVFTGFVVLLSTRDFSFACIACGVVFVVSVVVIAMLVLRSTASHDQHADMGAVCSSTTKQKRDLETETLQAATLDRDDQGCRSARAH